MTASLAAHPDAAPPAPSGFIRSGWALFAFALALRLPLLWSHDLVEGDGVNYARLAQQVLAGDWSGLANPYWSNLWPGAMAAAAWLTGLDVVTAGRWVSLLAGAALAPVTARLGARWLGPESGWASGLLVAGQPWLLVFSTLVFTESFYTLLAVSVLCVASHAAGWRGLVACGLLGGLAVVTRPEAQATALVAAAFAAWRSRGLGARAAATRAGLVLGLVAAFVVGRALLVRHYDGPWDFGFGLKGSANLLVGLAESDEERERLTTSTTDEDESELARAAQDLSVAAFAWAHPGALARLVVRNLCGAVACASRVLPPLPAAPGRRPLWSGGWPTGRAVMALGAALLATWGGWRAWRRPASRPGAALILLASTLQIAGLAVTLVHDRLLVSLTPAFAVFLGHGLAELRRRWVPHTAGPRLIAALVVAADLALARQVWGLRDLDYASEPAVQREAGEWLRARYPQTTRIVSGSPFVSYYFYDVGNDENESSLPWADGRGLLAVAQRRGARLLVLPEWNLRATHHPATAELLARRDAVPGLRLVALLGNEVTQRVFVYEVLASEAGAGAVH